jgi:hypothetical protein
VGDGKDAATPYGGGEGGTEMVEGRKHGLASLALAIAVGVIVGGLALGAIVWVIGAIFHVVSQVFHLALVIGVFAFVWWLVVGRRRASRIS